MSGWSAPHIVTVCCVVAVATVVADDVFSDPRGHLETFGRHTDWHMVPSIAAEVHPQTFHEDYIVKSKPVVLKAACKNYWPAFHRWSDQGLVEDYPDIKVMTEVGKKENRSQPSMAVTVRELVRLYKTGDVYCVTSIPKAMRRDLTLLPPLTCGGGDQHLQDLVMWFSSGGTKSVLHRDDLENIGCLLDGRKQFLMMDPTNIDGVDKLLDGGGYSKLDVDAVDLHKYSMVVGVPTWVANIEAGDCLFVPRGWLHQVRSWNRNMAVNMWFSRSEFDASSCGAELPEKGMSRALLERTKTLLSTLNFPEADRQVQEVDNMELGQQYDNNQPLDFNEFYDVLIGQRLARTREEVEFLWTKVFNKEDQTATLAEDVFDSVSDDHIRDTLRQYRRVMRASRRNNDGQPVKPKRKGKRREQQRKQRKKEEL